MTTCYVMREGEAIAFVSIQLLSQPAHLALQAFLDLPDHSATLTLFVLSLKCIGPHETNANRKAGWLPL